MRNIIEPILIVSQVLKALMENDFITPTVAIVESYPYFTVNS
ncbi:MAG: hypothetical protein V1932_08390 [Chloroflexota bacterium]